MSNRKEPLQKTAIMVLEDWAMMLVDPAKLRDVFSNIENPHFCSRIKFSGKNSGEICIIANKAFVNALTANVLGEDESEEMSEENSYDAFAEMANVVAGNFLTEAYGNNEPFDLLPPKVTEVTPELLESCSKDENAVCLLADSLPISVHILSES